MGSKRISTHGFSLIELLLVIVIIGILAAVGIRQLGGRDTSAVLSVVGQIEGTLYAAQRSATTTLATVELSATGSWPGKNFMLSYTGAAPADVFRQTASEADHERAGIHPGTSGWPSDLGAKPDIPSVEALAAPIVEAMDHPLMGLPGARVSVTGMRKEYTTPFFVAVVPYAEGAPISNGVAAIVVVDGHKIYKYFRPEAGKPWRRA